VLGGGVYFEEFVHFSIVQWTFFPLGVATTVVGAVILSKREMSDNPYAVKKEHSMTENEVESLPLMIKEATTMKIYNRIEMAAQDHTNSNVSSRSFSPVVSS
jgi:hypothetical protein